MIDEEKTMAYPVGRIEFGPAGFAGRLIRVTDQERVRSGWREWIGSMRMVEFGTLTLAPVHHKSCSSRKCDGRKGSRGSVHCRMPGVQKTEKLIATFRKLCDRSFVVEEYGKITGRRHFHYLAAGSTTKRLGERSCLRKMAGRPHKHHDVGWTAVGFFKKFGGHVDNTVVESMKKAIDYVLKDINDEETRVWFG